MLKQTRILHPFLIFIIAALTVWRLLALLGLMGLSWPLLWLSGLGGVLLLGLLLRRGLQSIGRVSGRSRPRRLLVGLGALLGSVAAWLWLNPAGLSRVQLEIEADNVWSPTAFELAWPGAGAGLDWSLPLRLPTTTPTPMALEITANPPTRTLGEVWLLNAVRPDGTVIAVDDFEPEGDWQQREVSWGDYEKQVVWVGRSGGVLRWQGLATGPLTLLFAKHDRADTTTIRWGESSQRLDLFSPVVALEGVTLPLNQPPVWRVDLPSSALAQPLRLVLALDPNDDFLSVLRRVRVTNALGRTVELSGAALLAALDIRLGSATLTEGEDGILFDQRKADKAPEVVLTQRALPHLTGVEEFLPGLENGLVIFYVGLLAALGGGLLGARLPQPLLPGLTLMLASLGLTLLLVEVGLQWYLPALGLYYPRPPNIQRLYLPDPTVMPGVFGESRYITNSQGLRGDEPTADAYQILTVGGSSTECLALDQEEAWPYLLQEALTAAGQNTWVGNAGQSGRTTREHIMHLRYLLPQYPDVDAVALLIGINDLNLPLSQGNAYNPHELDSPAAQRATIERAFYLRVERDPTQPHYQTTGVWRLISQFQDARRQHEAAIGGVEVYDDPNSGYIQARQQRRESPIVEVMPDLSTALDEYARNINTMIDIAEANEVRLILMTQPTMWRPDLSVEEEALMWFGWGPGREFYYPLAAMEAGMRAYNHRLLQVCEERQVECIDLANALPKDTTVFYDDVHFNEQGAVQVAAIVVDYLLQPPPGH